MSEYHPQKSLIDWRNKNWLYDHYITKKLSWPEIGRIVDRTPNAVRLAAKSFGITSRSCYEASNKRDIDLDNIRQMYDDGYSITDIAKSLKIAYSVIYTRMCRYNIKRRNPAKGRSISHILKHKLLPKSEWANTDWLTKQYKTKSINEIANDINWSYTAVHDTMAGLGIQLRNTKNAISLKWADNKYRTKCLVYGPPGSSLQIKLYNLLDELGVQYYREGPKTNICKYYRPLDCIVLPGTNRPKPMIIEVNGYLHLQNKIANKDRSKLTYIRKYLPEYDFEYVWDHDLWGTDVIKKLCGLLKIDQPIVKYSFSSLHIQSITYSETKQFLQLYHYLGKGRGGKCFGVFLNEKLIACLVLSPLLRQNIAQQFNLGHRRIREISRLCVHPIYRKKNLISWFISRMIKLIECELIISYADTTVGHTGACYKACNFKLHHQVPADYWYADSDDIYMHKKTLYNKAKAASMTESEFVIYFGYKKIIGKHKYCFIYQCK